MDDTEGYTSVQPLCLCSAVWPPVVKGIPASVIKYQSLGLTIHWTNNVSYSSYSSIQKISKNHHQSPTCFIVFPSYLVMYLSLLAKFGSGHQGVAWGPRLEAKACTAWRSFHGRHGHHGDVPLPSIRLRKYQTVISPRTLVTAWWPKRCYRDVHKRQGYPSDIMTKYTICIHKMYIPIGSMYAIYGDIYHQYTPNVSIYTIHGSYGIINLD